MNSDTTGPINVPTRLRDRLTPAVKRVIMGSTTTVAVLGIALAACGTTSSDKVSEQRDAKIANVKLCGDQGESQECVNLKKKFERDNDPNRVTYVYLLSWTGEFIGYYVAKGKVSSNQSQMGPMDTKMQLCTWSDSGCWGIVEAPGDDGSYGPNEDGIFFFAVDGTKITWNGMYVQSDRPLTIKAPLLYGTAS